MPEFANPVGTARTGESLGWIRHLRILGPADRIPLTSRTIRPFVFIQSLKSYIIISVICLNNVFVNILSEFLDRINICTCRLTGAKQHFKSLSLSLSRAHAFANDRYLLWQDRAIVWNNTAFPWSFRNRKHCQATARFSYSICSKCSTYITSCGFFPWPFIFCLFFSTWCLLSTSN